MLCTALFSGLINYFGGHFAFFATGLHLISMLTSKSGSQMIPGVDAVWYSLAPVGNKRSCYCFVVRDTDSLMAVPGDCGGRHFGNSYGRLCITAYAVGKQRCRLGHGISLQLIVQEH